MSSDWFTRAFGAAVKDVREKLIEEPWFGRALERPDAKRNMAQELGWEKEKSPTEPDHGIDR